MNHVLGTAPKDLIQTFLTELTNARENQYSPTGTGKNELHPSAPVRSLLLVEVLSPESDFFCLPPFLEKGALAHSSGPPVALKRRSTADLNQP